MKHQPKNKSEKQKRRERQRRRHTIHVVNGRPVHVPNVPGLDPTNIPFLGQEMVCIMCGRQQRSDPHVESQWRCIMVDDVSYYVCPAEFPPDDANKEAFTAAYIKVLTKIASIGENHGQKKY